MTKPPARTPPKAPAIAAAAVLLAATMLTAPSEGLKLKPYWDPAHIRSVCFGETQGVRERSYSRPECEAMLEQRMTRDYAAPVERCLPELADDRRLGAFAAFIDAAYNAGAGAVCSSRMARSVHAGRWDEACAGFYGWRATALDRRTGKRIQLKGLETRRAKEAALCSSHTTVELVEERGD